MNCKELYEETHESTMYLSVNSKSCSMRNIFQIT